MKTKQIRTTSMLNVECWMFDVLLTFLLASSASASATVRYVDVNGASPTPPYTNWATAARVIQDAVDAAAPGDTVLVTNGVYSVGSRDVSVLDTNAEPPVAVSRGSSRVVIMNSIRVESVNGPEVTVIEGSRVDYTTREGAAIRCAYLGNASILSGFTLTIGSSWHGAGGVFCENSGVVTNCLINGNSASSEGGGAYGGALYNCTLTGNSARYGGGAFGSTLYNCTLTGNSVYGLGGGAFGSALYNCMLSGNTAFRVGVAVLGEGGGAYGGTMNNCTLTGNSADWGGGGAAGGTLSNCTLTGNWAYRYGGGAAGSALYNCTLAGNSTEYDGGGAFDCTLNNCIAYFNSATNGANYYYQDQNGGVLNYCCTTPMPTNGVGNITNVPLFVDATHGDFRLRPGSPCIDTGTNLTGTITTDITGLPRPMDGNYDGVAKFDMGAYEFNPYRFEPTLSLTADGFQFTIRGEPGRSVRIERSRDLVNWEFAGQVPIPANGQTLIDPAAITETKLFYRAVSLP